MPDAGADPEQSHIASSHATHTTPHSIAPRARPGLAVDTAVLRHGARVPQLVFPQEKPGSQKDTTAFGTRKESTKTKVNQNLLDLLKSRAYTRAGPSKAVGQDDFQVAHKIKSGRALQGEFPANVSTNSQDSVISLPLHSRTKGLRPSPLDLDTDISPFDRNIPIALDVPMSRFGPQNPMQRTLQTVPNARSEYASAGRGQDAQTPTIVITPAKENFDSNDLSVELLQLRNRRHASSLYSRTTDGHPRQRYEDTPPVPPLPLFAGNSASTASGGRTPFSAWAESDDEPTPSYSEFESKHDQNSTRKRALVDGPSPPPYTPSADVHAASSPWNIPTPRRSRGWWNVVTSPFSASSMARAFSFRSIDYGGRGVEENAKSTASNSSSAGVSKPRHAGTSEFQRTINDDELRSAPVSNSGARALQLSTFKPRRSETAPGALDLGNINEVNIYRLPSGGTAYAYYRKDRDVSNNIRQVSTEAGIARLVDDGFSPSQSVHRGSVNERGLKGAASDDIMVLHEGESAGYYDIDRVFASPVLSAETTSSCGNDYPFSARTPFSDTGCSAFHDAQGLQFAPPASIIRPPYSESNQSRLRVTEGRLSPLSPSPIMENASTGTFINTKYSPSEIREIEVSRAQTPLAHDPGRQIATTTFDAGEPPGPAPHHKFAADRGEQDVYSCSTGYHSRTGSTGLGISDAGSDRPLFTPHVQALAEKFGPGVTEGSAPRLEDEEDVQPQRSCFRRFRWIWLAAAVAFFALLVTLLFVFLPLHHHHVAVEAHWLDLAGFPALPTGVATVIGAKQVKAVDGCVKPTVLWSCAAPPYEGLTTTQPSQPNFRFMIWFQNGTFPANETALASTNSSVAGRNSTSLLRRDSLTPGTRRLDYTNSPSPAPPSIEDMAFLGRTTDNVDAPYQGERTPFFISVLDPKPLESNDGSKLRKRDADFSYPYPDSSASSSVPTSTSRTASRSISSTSTFVHIHETKPFHYPTPSHSSLDSGSHTPVTNAQSIPTPSLRPDNSNLPAKPLLYPLPTSQPLRLFNRGRETEHYSFYTYFDRTLYPSSSHSPNHNTNHNTNLTSATPSKHATEFCSWSQTRFLVQIWTKAPLVNTLPRSPASASAAAVNSTANDMTSPGSFPYRVTVTLDRHGRGNSDAGGAEEEKGVFCWDLDEQGRIEREKGRWVKEDRGFGGTLVEGKKSSGRDARIDGGSGGCGCAWQNW